MESSMGHESLGITESGMNHEPLMKSGFLIIGINCTV